MRYFSIVIAIISSNIAIFSILQITSIIAKISCRAILRFFDIISIITIIGIIGIISIIDIIWIIPIIIFIDIIRIILIISIIDISIIIDIISIIPNLSIIDIICILPIISIIDIIRSIYVTSIIDIIIFIFVLRFVAVFFRGECNEEDDDCAGVLAKVNSTSFKDLSPLFKELVHNFVQLEAVDDDLDEIGILLVSTPDTEVAKENGENGDSANRDMDKDETVASHSKSDNDDK